MAYSPYVDKTLSIVNSTDETLSASAEYTGTFETSQQPTAQIWVKSEKAATLFIEFSPDGGTTVDQFPFGGITLEAGIPFYDHVEVGNQSFRVRVLDTSASTNDVIVLVGYGYMGRPASPVSTGISQGQSAINTKSVLFAKDSATSHVEIIGNKGGAILTAPFDIEVSLGRVPNYANGAKFGRVSGIDAADSARDIWAFADDALGTRADQKTFPTSADTLYVTSSSTSDTDVDVVLEYIDSTGAAAEVMVTTNGQTPVSTGVTGLDVNRMRIDNENLNVGALYASQGNAFVLGLPTDTTKVLAVAPAGYGQSQLSHFTVPLGQTLVMRSALLTVSRANGSQGSADVTLRKKPFGKAQRVIREWFPTTTSPLQTPDTHIIFEARSQVTWRVDDVSDGDTQLSVVFIYDLVSD